MQILPLNINELSFGSKKTFKKLFRKCTYSGEGFDKKDTKTIEHIIPLSEGGPNELSNYLVVKRSWNSKRSSVPLDVFIKENPQVKENIIRTIKEHEGEEIDGIIWSDAVKTTLKKAIGYDIFS